MNKLLALSLFLCAAHSHADSLRCGSKLISSGDSKGSVEQICGAPASTDSYCKPSAQNKTNSATANQDCTRVDIWRYNRGAGQLGAEIEFQMGEVTAIRNTDRE
ncbi:MAG TPA: DUF2845 domain-containing protein [Cellvibrionaceae bacterium]|nr:DUF2845 domain-containing protein [Cellvibrionaceae bacterium]